MCGEGGCGGVPSAGCGRCWLKPAGLKLLLTSNQSKATYWLNKFNWQQQQWHEQQGEGGRVGGEEDDSSSNDNDTLMQV